MSKTKLKIHTWPDEILRKKCKKVKKVDASTRALLDEMLSLMRVNLGVGLAANQAGLDLSLVVIEAEGKTLKLVNPRVVKGEGLICFREGCLSFPGLEMDIKRKNKVKIAALNEKGEKINFDAEGVLAVVLQHEIDHTNGIVFIDKISLWQRLKVIAKLKSIKKSSGSPKG